METTPPENPFPGIIFENVEDKETIHQRCVIIKARFSPIANSPHMVTVEQKTRRGDELYPPQTWPVEDGRTKIIVMLTAGKNFLSIYPNSNATQVYKLQLGYTPILRNPPLHLAVMIASDSDLMIDYEPRKHLSLGDHPGSLDTALGRFRMTAYMWQAMIAEDMRLKGLSRRSFRLDEGWEVDTTSARFPHGVHQAEIWETGAARETAKIHLVTSSHTLEEIRDAKIARDNPLGSNSKTLYTWFMEALQSSGVGIFTASARPVVAGLILDANWVEEDLFVHGHTALGSHDPKGVSLGIFGSQFIYSWPQHLEQINSFLRDASLPQQGVVSTANSATGTMWEVCSIGQMDFLHQVGHAFGAGHTTGIMRGGCAQHWPRNFVARTPPDRVTCEDGIVIDGDTANKAVFDIKDLLAFSLQPHFWMQGDRRLSEPLLAARQVVPSIRVEDYESDDGTAEQHIVTESPANIVRILWNGVPGSPPSLADPVGGARIPLNRIENKHPRDKPLCVAFLAGNGKERVVKNIWDLVADPATLAIPGSDVVLQRRYVRCNNLEQLGPDDMENESFWRWATLLTKPMAHGTIVRANEIDICVGKNLLGLYVRFEDGIRVNCGPRFLSVAGGKYDAHYIGDKEELMVPPSCEVVCVEVARDPEFLRGVRIHLSNGDAKGLSADSSDPVELCILEPPSGERIVGFFGRNYFGRHLDAMVEFGIITAPRGVVLPARVHHMPQLQNTDGGLTEDNYDREDDPTVLAADEPDSDDDDDDDADDDDFDAPNDLDDSDDAMMAATDHLDLGGLDLEG